MTYTKLNQYSEWQCESGSCILIQYVKGSIIIIERQIFCGQNNLNNNYKIKISYMSFQIRAVDKTYATFRTAEPGIKALSRT